MDLELADRAFVITGGTDGLGLALAQTLTSEGARVAVCGRDPQRLARAREIVGDRGLAIAADVTDAAALENFVHQAITTFGRLDGAVSNAGRALGAPVARSTDEQWQEDFELKVLAAVRLARLTADAICDAQGSFLSVLTIKAKAPDAGATPTAASRAAGLAITKSLSHEWGPRGARANAILVGLVASGQWRRVAEGSGVDEDELYRVMAERQPIALGRVGRAEEFADLAAFLLSPRASYLTGVGINFDGGLSPVV
jgi:NAD(P)-dependent dehydrogenase (short-subunit alcohol dehydrogenase family)